MATNAMSKTMTRFWMESKISEDSRWHSKHKGDFRTEDQLADHFVGKLRDQCRHEKSEVAIMVRFTRMLKEQLESYESQTNLLLKLADTGRVAVLLHKHIDIALDTLDIMEPAKREKWHDQLLRERRKRLKVFKKFVKEDEKVKAALGDNNQQLEIVTLLRYCVEKYGLVKAADENEQYRDKLMEAELDTIAAVYELVVQKAGIVSSKLPVWFVTSEHEWEWVNKAKIEDSKETWDSRAREKFIDENLSEEVHGEVCEEVCVRLASIWTELNHPHLRKFYGASYVGKPFVIHESCFTPTYEKDLWRYVSNCALGLQYVHDRGLVYYDLSPSIVLSSYSERRGVVDGFGLVQRHKANQLHPSDSESPMTQEVLRFGISVFFLLASARNSNLPSDERDKTFDTWKYKSTTQLPDARPRFINEEEWEILQGLCASNPTERLGLVNAEFKMRSLAPQDTKSADTKVDQSCEKRIDLSEYMYPSSWKTLAEMLDESEQACGRIENSRERSMDQRVLIRFQGMYQQLQMSSELLTEKDLEAFCALLWRFQKNVEADDLDSSAAHPVSQTMANMRSRYHHQIDQLIRSSPLLQHSRNEYCHQWYPSWEQGQENQYALFRSCSDNPARFFEEVSKDQWPEALAFMRFEVHHCAGAYSPETVNKMNLVLQEAASRAEEIPELQHVDLGQPLPKWFVMNYQIELGKHIGTGGFGSVYRGKWFGTDVVVKLLNAEKITDKIREDFRREADLWFTLNHSNLIKLYGACYEGKQPFFVCERATRLTLVEYLEPSKGRRHETWFRLLQAALGIQHLHDNGIVHGDLKGNNILVCDGGATKLADFGLSILATTSATSEGTMTTGAVRWKAPECLKGERPSFASDIYAFGSCIIEAVTGKYPWVGIVEEASVVEQIVKDGKMHPRTTGFEDNEWKLVEQMCRWSPQKRIGIGAVIKILEDIGVRKLMTTAGMIGPTTVDRKTLT